MVNIKNELEMKSEWYCEEAEKINNFILLPILHEVNKRK
jgi:hypothetical protein